MVKRYNIWLNMISYYVLRNYMKKIYQKNIFEKNKY